MGKPELGQKCTCVSCSARFFDLGKNPAICPKCGTEQPKVKPRVFAPSRPTARSWSSQAQKTQAAAPAEATEAAEESDDDVSVLDDEDGVEAEVTEEKDENSDREE
jgi:uncharacterized protein (TIGR02300 family)